MRIEKKKIGKNWIERFFSVFVSCPAMRNAYEWSFCHRMRTSEYTHRRILCFPLWSNGKFATSQEWIVRVLKNRALSKWCLVNCELLWVLTQRRYQQQHQQQPQKMRIIHSNGANSSNMCMANSFLLTHETTLVYLSVVLWHILCMPFSIARLAHSHCGYAQYCVL